MTADSPALLVAVTIAPLTVTKLEPPATSSTIFPARAEFFVGMTKVAAVSNPGKTETFNVTSAY